MVIHRTLMTELGGLIIILEPPHEDLVIIRVTIDLSKIQMCGILHHQCKKIENQSKEYLKIFLVINPTLPKVEKELKKALTQTVKKLFFQIDILMEMDLIPI